MDYIRAFGVHTFSSFAIPNYRRYFVGLVLSNIGTWMHIVALGWLVVVITGSGVALGSVLAARFAPLLLGSLYAGALVDSFDKRRILYATQSILAVLALLMSVLVFTGHIEMWMVYVIALFVGMADAVDRPARQTFVHEMVGPEYLRNAVSLNSTQANLARALGPLFAGGLIAGIGIAFCFLANAISFIAFLITLIRLDASTLHPEYKETRKVDSVLAGLQYAASVPVIWTILVAMAIIGTFAYEFQTSLPLFAGTTFMGGAADYAALLSAMGIGSVMGGLFAASRKDIVKGEFVAWAFLFGISVCVVALMPTLSLAIIGMLFVGFFSITLTTTGNTMLQLQSEPHMRGRVMSLWTMAIFGSTVVGAPIIGYIGEHVSPRFALIIGGIATLIAAGYAARRLLDRYDVFTVPAFIKIRREEASVENTRA